MRRRWPITRRERDRPSVSASVRQESGPSFAPKASEALFEAWHVMANQGDLDHLLTCSGTADQRHRSRREPEGIGHCSERRRAGPTLVRGFYDADQQGAIVRAADLGHRGARPDMERHSHDRALAGVGGDSTTRRRGHLRRAWTAVLPASHRRFDPSLLGPPVAARATGTGRTALVTPRRTLGQSCPFRPDGVGEDAGLP